MTYRGTIRNRVVIFEGEAPPEGTAVQVEPVEATAASDNAHESKTKTVWDKLLEIQGLAPSLPEDAAPNHDHYLYGTPKK